MKKLLIFSLLGLFNLSNAWNGHYLITHHALASANKSVYEQNVTVESLQHFLEDTKNKLPQELAAIEAWALRTQDAHKPLTKELSFDPNNSACVANITTCFKKSLRINLDVPLVPIIYDPDNLVQNNLIIADISQLMLKEEVSAASHLISDNTFKYVKDGDKVPLITVITASSDEPDFGLDISLYQDNNSEVGKVYGFGNQPIGDVGLKYTSQSLFHMASYNLPTVFTAIKPDLKFSYPQYRFYEYTHLAKFAKAAGHPYWAGRFTGWALHYLQDMTQPYHANLFNGISSWYIFMAYIESFAINGPIIAVQNKLQQRHIVNENMAGYLLSGKNTHFENERWQMQQALANKIYDTKIPVCNLDYNYLIKVVMPETNIIGKEYSQALLSIFPKDLVDNGAGIDLDKINYFNVYSDFSLENRKQLFQLYANRMNHVGAYTRSCASLVF